MQEVQDLSMAQEKQLELVSLAIENMRKKLLNRTDIKVHLWLRTL